MPISQYALHDEWISLICCAKTKVVFTNDNLVKYRAHSEQKVGVFSLLSIIELYKKLKQFKMSDIEQELKKVTDMLLRFRNLEIDKEILYILEQKQKLLVIRTNKSKFRFFILLWQFIIGKYNLYTYGKWKAFVKDLFIKI